MRFTYCCAQTALVTAMVSLKRAGRMSDSVSAILPERGAIRSVIPPYGQLPSLAMRLVIASQHAVDAGLIAFAL